MMIMTYYFIFFSVETGDHMADSRRMEPKAFEILFMCVISGVDSGALRMPSSGALFESLWAGEWRENPEENEHIVYVSLAARSTLPSVAVLP